MKFIFYGGILHLWTSQDTNTVKASEYIKFFGNKISDYTQWLQKYP